MRRVLTTLAVAAVLAASLASFAAPAGASVSPTGGKTGTSTVGVAFSGISVSCTGATFTGTWSSPFTPPLTISTNMQLFFSGCVRTGGIPTTIACANTAVLTVTGRTLSNITPMTLTGVSCRVTWTATCGATLSGAVNAPYDNVPVAMVVSTTGQTLTISGTTCAGVYPNGSTTLTTSGGGAVNYQMTPVTTVSY